MMLEVDIGHNATIPIEIVEFIILVLMVEVELGLKRPSTFTLTIVEQEVILKGDVDIGIIPAPLPCASQEVVVYC